jgi:callose synthase
LAIRESLLIWQMANQLNEMVEENYFQPPPGFEEEGSFLKVVIEPIYKVLQKVSM